MVRRLFIKTPRDDDAIVGSARQSGHQGGAIRAAISYATTEADARNVGTGREAVARYALPDPAPASFVFTILPDGGTVIQRGTVQPAFGQPGGGVEVLLMRIRLDERWTRRLTALPESGMGYHRVDVRLADGRELADVLVFNAEEIELPDEFATVRIADVRPHVVVR